MNQGYIGYIRADQLIRIATKNNDEGQIEINPSVFFDNVRDFDPNSKINKNIIDETRNGDRSGFVFRNNGVTVIARTINRTGDRFAITDYQIVNGCQTTNILFQCREHIEEIHVPFRLIESDNEDFVTTIIVGTNTQNPVKDEQFWALRPFMKDLEEYCGQQQGDYRLFVERRENQFRKDSVERTRIVKPSEIMKTIAAMYLLEPHRAARDFRGIRTDYDEEIFQTHHNVVPYHLACYANYKFEFFVRNRRLNRSKRIFKYYILCALGYKHFEGRSVFKLPRRVQEECCRRLRRALEGEGEYLDFCGRVIDVIEGILSDREDSPRERLRDALRSETVSRQFRQELANL